MAEDDEDGHERRGEFASRKRATHRMQLADVLLSRGGGSLLRGWRRELDPDGSLDIGIDECVWHLQRLHCQGVDVKSLVDESGEVTLEAVHKESAELVNRVRDWIKDTFGDPAVMWDALDSKKTGTLERDSFRAACKANGLQASEEEMGQIFSFVDVDEGGSISKEEILFLEKDPEARDLMIFKEKMKTAGQVQRLMASVYWTDAHADHAPSSRKSVRPWLATGFENLPPLVIVRRQQRIREARQLQRTSKATFLQYLRQKYGSFARAWRRGLDPQARFSIDKMAVRHFCRCAELDINPSVLWTALDTDSDGQLGLQDISSSGAVELATFRGWAQSNFGSCSDVWNQPQLVKVRAAPQGDPVRGQLISTKKVLLPHFIDAMKAMGWRSPSDRDGQAELWSGLDFFNAGIVCQADLKWLDSWEPPLWLNAEPSQEAWEDVKKALLNKYGLPLKAWRHLDTDGQNEVSWTEFLAGCRKIRWKGDAGAAWRFIDNDASGFISMQEFSPEHYELLMSFKEWASEMHGSVGSAFKNFDNDGSGSLTFGELRRACQRGKWGGEVRALFECLGNNKEGGKQNVSATELAFLDTWPDRNDDAEDEDEEAVEEKPQEDRVRSAAGSTRKKPASAGHGARGGLSGEQRPMTSPPDPASPSNAAATPKAKMSPLREEPARETTPAPDKVAAEKLLKRTYKCSKDFLRRDKLMRKTLAAKTGLPWLEKISKIDAPPDLGVARPKRSASAGRLQREHLQDALVAP